MRGFATVMALLALAAVACAQGTWIPKDGQCPWYDRIGRYVIGELPEKYVSDKPVPQQACNEPRTLTLPEEGVDQVTVAISATEAKDWAKKLGLEETGDSLKLMDAAGTKAVMEYTILIYRKPPKVTEFPGAKAGVMLLSWPGEAPAPAEIPAAAIPQGSYTPSEKAAPWSDRIGQWVMVDVPAAVKHGKPVPQQSCTARSLVLPQDGLEAVTIALSEGDLDKLPEDLRKRVEMTGVGLGVQAPAGGAKLPYQIAILRKPQKQFAQKTLGGGIILLALEDLSGQLSGAPPKPAEAPKPLPEGTFTPAERAWPWHDRGPAGPTQWLLVDVPKGLQHGEAIPQQACGPRTLVLPDDGLEAVTFGLTEKDLAEKLPAELKAAITDTGARFAVQHPGGGEKLVYAVAIYKEPKRETTFTGFGAGVILLALKDLSPVLSGQAGPETSPKGGAKGVLQSEQEFVAQEWPFQPGERKVKMHVEEPPQGINEQTGLMLCLHNWGGIYDQSPYIQWCKTFAARYNVVAASVNYLQSGQGEPTVIGEKPYDHGYLQAIDCLRALYHIRKQIADAGLKFNPHRCYSMGGSGGGNVTLMVNKLAPSSFACVVDICGMPGLTDGIAYGTGEYGSHLNAGYSQDPESPAYLTRDMQEIRDPGHPGHLKAQFAVNPKNRVIIVHGQDDLSCPVVHKITVFRNMVDAGFRPEGHFLTDWHVDGAAVKTTGHAVGDREQVVIRFADEYMKQDGKSALQVPGPDDFERGGEVAFPTTGGRFVVDYSGPPTVRFETGHE